MKKINFNAKKLGANIRRLRLKAGMSQHAMAETFGVTPATVCLWEKGSVKPSVKMVCDICNHFDVKVDALLF